MALSKDIRFDDETNDLQIDAETGDFLISESDTRHVSDIIESFSGWWKESPTVGVGIRRNSGASGNGQRVTREVHVQLTADGYEVDGIEIDKEGQIFVTGKRKDVNL